MPYTALPCAVEVSNTIYYIILYYIILYYIILYYIILYYIVYFSTIYIIHINTSLTFSWPVNLTYLVLGRNTPLIVLKILGTMVQNLVG